MKDIPVFSCPDGIATLILREVPFRGEGYILVRGVFGTLEGLLAECTGFCRAAGAERLFAAGEADFSGYPAAIRILGRSAPRESLLPAPEAVRLVPVTEETAADWAREYNARFRAVPAAESCSPAEERALAVRMAGENGILFGLDFPYNDVAKIRQGIESVLAMDVSETCKEKILGGNLRGILGID